MRRKGLKTIRFTIKTRLLGYKQTTTRSIYHRSNRERSKSYGAFKSFVLFQAILAGLGNKGFAEKDRPPRLSVHVFWVKDPRIDWSNVYKAIEDALYYQKEDGADRFVVPGPYSGVTWDAGVEKAEVIVEIPE